MKELKGIEREIKALGEEVTSAIQGQATRELQLKTTLKDIAGWAADPVRGDPGLCGLNCQLMQLNDNLEKMNDTHDKIYQSLRAMLFSLRGYELRKTDSATKQGYELQKTDKTDGATK